MEREKKVGWLSKVKTDWKCSKLIGRLRGWVNWVGVWVNGNLSRYCVSGRLSELLIEWIWLNLSLLFLILLLLEWTSVIALLLLLLVEEDYLYYYAIIHLVISSEKSSLSLDIEIIVLSSFKLSRRWRGESVISKLIGLLEFLLHFQVIFFETQNHFKRGSFSVGHLVLNANGLRSHLIARSRCE